MINKKIGFTLLTFLSLVITSCSLELNEVYYGNAYNSSVFAENYYRIWDSRINEDNPNNKILSEKEIELDKEEDLVFTSFYKGFEREEGYDPSNPPQVTELIINENLLRNDSDVKNYRFMKDVFGFSEQVLDALKAKELYGDAFKLSSYDSSFKKGILSKLYDGRLYCGGGYERVRVQIDEGGFGTVFSKQSDNLEHSYFAMSFKPAVDYTQEDKPATKHASDIKIKISFYCRNDDKFDKVTYTYPLYGLSCNYSDIRIYDNYTFFGFKIDSEIIKNLQGYSIEYELINDVDVQDKDLDHALMIYEVLFPYSTWR